MASRSRSGSSPTASQQEVLAMALVLEARHGVLAEPIAEFFVALHKARKDEGRMAGWRNVSALVRRREAQRTIEC